MLKLSTGKKASLIGIGLYFIATGLAMWFFVRGIAEFWILGVAGGRKEQFDQRMTIINIEALSPFLLLPLAGLIWIFFVRNQVSLKTKIIVLVIFCIASVTPYLWFYAIYNSQWFENWAVREVNKSFEKHEGRNVGYWDNGKLYSEEFYKNEVKDGWQKYYYQNGQLRKSEFYVDGVQEEEEREYYKNGQLQFLVHYKNGQWHGRFNNYNENGKLVRDEEWAEGQIVGCYVVQSGSLCDSFIKDGRVELKQATPSGGL